MAGYSGARVDSRFDAADTYADLAWGITEDYINSLLEQSTSGEEDDLVVDFPEVILGTASPLPERPEDLVASEVFGTVDNSPELPIYLDVDTWGIDSMSLPATDYGDLVADIPTAPSIDSIAAPGDGPVVNYPEVPNPPDLTFPDPPNLDEITMPDSPDLETINFTGALPTFEEPAPDGTFFYSEAVYQSILKDPLDAKILEGLVNGGTGLDPDTEDAIYLRGRARLAEERSIEYTMAENMYSSRGFTLPPGAIQARLSEIDRKFINSLDDINRDIIVKQAELTWQNIKETITAGTTRENSLMEYSNQVAQRAFDSAKYTLEAGILSYNAKVTAYQAKLDGYKTQASVYTERVKAQLAKVEVYKATVQGKLAESDVQKNMVAIYTAQLDSIKVEAEIYQITMQRAVILGEIEKLKVEIFGAEVDVYKNKVEAETLKFNMYQAQIQGELGKVEIFKAKIEGYEAKIRGYNAEIDFKIKKLQIKMDVNKEKTMLYATEIEGYKLALQKNTVEIQSKLDIYKSEISMYTADAQIYSVDTTQKIEEYKAKMQKAAAEVELNLKASEINLQKALQENELRVEAAKTGANVSAQIVASALSSVNASASVGYSNNLSNSYATNRNYNYSE